MYTDTLLHTQTHTKRARDSSNCPRARARSIRPRVSWRKRERKREVLIKGMLYTLAFSERSSLPIIDLCDCRVCVGMYVGTAYGAIGNANKFVKSWKCACLTIVCVCEGVCR